jgi:hypothetical protein
MTDAAVASLATMAITVAGFAFQAWRQHVAFKLVERQRAWDLEDRERARVEVAEKAEFVAAMLAAKTVETGRTLAAHTDTVAGLLAEKTEAGLAVLAAKSDVRNEQLVVQIASVQEAAANAFDVGNHSAEKLEKVNVHLENLHQRLLDTSAELERRKP